MKRKDIFTTIILFLTVFYLGYFTKFQTTHHLETLVKKSTQSIVFVQTEVKATKGKNRFLDLYTSNRKRIQTGTGFFVSPQYIVTNNHVIANGIKYTIRISTSSEPIDATLVGKDSVTDLAVLKIDPSKIDKKSIRLIKWGESHEMKIGQPVYAIGHPYGLNFSVTKGIISYDERYLNNPYQEVIQTDAAINSGNSGGPLFNMEGEVIGINTFIFNRNRSRTGSGGSIGLNFAVSQFTAEFIVDELIEKGKIERAWLGLGLKFQESTKTVIIYSFAKTGPASKSGLFINDEIIWINGHKIKDFQDFFIYLEHNVFPNQKIRLKIRRYGDHDMKPSEFYISLVTGTQPEVLPTDE